MKLSRRSIAATAAGLAIVVGSVLSAAPANAAGGIVWISKTSQAACQGAVVGTIANLASAGHTGIKSSSCTYLSTRKVWEAWVSYTA